MSDCPHKLKLQASHDGELAPGDALALHRHVLECPECAAELAEFRELSEWLSQRRPAEILPLELARIHRAVERSEDRGFLRLAVGMSGIAASILIVSAAWLHDGPRPATVVSEVAPHQQSWEYLATTGRVQQVPQGVPETGVAEADTAKWMVTSLGGHGGK